MRAKKRWRRKKTPPPLRRPVASEPNPRHPTRAGASRANLRLVWVIQLSTTSSNRTVIGSRPATTVTCFIRAKRKVRVPGAPTRTAAGFTPTRVGRGSRKNRLAGPLITTGVGRVCVASVGFGFQEINGRRHGFRGGKAMITSGGRLYRPKRDLISALAFAIGPTIITT